MSEKLTNISNFISKEKITKLQGILDTHSENLDNFEGNSDDILKAYRFKKPLSSIEVNNKAPEDVLQFIEELEEFFFAGYAIS